MFNYFGSWKSSADARMVDYYCLLAFLFALATSGFARSVDSRRAVPTDVRRLGAANNELALTIYRQLTSGSSDNVFFSPLSLSTAFGMLYYGTRGDTAEELRTALGYEKAGLTDGLVHPSFRRYLTESLPSSDSAAYTLSSANAVLLDKQLDVVPEYRTGLRDYYGASVKDVDFASQGPQVVRQINDWVKEMTNGKIDNLLEELDPSTLLVLLNAVHFKGTWKTQFDPSETSPWTFHNNGIESNPKKIDMMWLTKEFPYAESDDAQILELPYKGGNLSMIILLPNKLDGLGSLERSLTPARLLELRRRLADQEVHVTIPKFKLEYSRELSGAFQSAGARKVFTPAADFSGITRSGDKLEVSQVLHKAVIEVNEEGSEAAAVTGIISNRFGDDTPYFRVDRPFLFTIVDRRWDIILFFGRVTKL